MERKLVEYYNNSNVSNDVLDRMKNIALLRYNAEDGDVTSNIIKSLESVCYGIFDTDLVNIVLGEDWFLIYVSDCDDVVFEAWVASDTVDNKLDQSMEMYKEFKKILLANSDKNFFASMKKTTSYNFYRKMLDMGYVEEFDEISSFAYYTPFEIVEEIMMNCGSLDCYLKSGSDECGFNEKAKEYVFCDVEFGVTDKFVKKYKK